ncbi:MAG: mucoidy inhibitor MuiA family protein [Kibdelosporangium sp.]
MTSTLEAPIVAVTVYPGQARITRRTTVDLAAGEQRAEVGGLPLGLQRDSVRVNGRGQATVLGVDVAAQRHPHTPDVAVRELDQRVKELRGALKEVADNVSVEDSRIALLTALGHKTGGTFAKALAKGEIEPDRIAGLTDSLAGQLAGALGRKRGLADQALELQEELAAAERTLAAHRNQNAPDRLAVFVDLDAQAAGTVELELSYVVNDAQWASGYDIRLVGEDLTLTWHAEITQSTGEDWPECELALSTARPANTAQIPELSPWYLDRRQPVPPPMPVMAERAGYGAPGVVAAPAPMMSAARFSAPPPPVIEHGAAATTYRPTRQVAVPADGTAHRTTVAVIDLAATVDHITAPILSLEAFLRATAVNTSEHTLRPGRASVFHDSEFVGTTGLEVWSPGEEVELNLGIDDRIRVERELVRRTAGKAVLGGTKRREAEYRIKIGNFGQRRTTVTVLDQIPVSRDDGIVIKDVSCKPEPRQRTDLGELTWEVSLDPGKSAEISAGFRVDVARGVEIQGWRE